MEKRLLSLYSYQKILQPIFVFEFGATFALKLLEFSGHMSFQFIWKYGVVEGTKPPCVRYTSVFQQFSRIIPTVESILGCIVKAKLS